MKIFITGANGLVGSFVVRSVLQLNHSPVLLLRKNSDRKLLNTILNLCIIKEGDVLDELFLENCFAECEVVIHCAGVVSFNTSRNKEIFDINVQGTTNVVNACIKTKIKKLIHVSSVAALGRNELESLYNERAKWEDSPFNSSYAKSKYLAELEVFRGGEEGLNYSIVNPSVIIGPGDPQRSSTRILTYLRKLKYFYPPGHLNIVDVRDVAHVITSLITIEHQNRLVINSGSLSYRELYKIVFREYNMNPPVRIVPMWVIRIVSFLDRIKRMFTGGEPFITKENLRFLGRNFTYNSLFYNNLFHSNLISPEESLRYTIKELQTVASAE